MTGNGNAWKDQPTYSSNTGAGSTVKGIVAYADSSNPCYCVAGLMSLHLTSGL